MRNFALLCLLFALAIPAAAQEIVSVPTPETVPSWVFIGFFLVIALLAAFLGVSQPPEFWPNRRAEAARTETEIDDLIVAVSELVATKLIQRLNEIDFDYDDDEPAPLDKSAEKRDTLQ